MKQHRIRFQPLPSPSDQVEDVYLHPDYDGDHAEISPWMVNASPMTAPSDCPGGVRSSV